MKLKARKLFQAVFFRGGLEGFLGHREAPELIIFDEVLADGLVQGGELEVYFLFRGRGGGDAFVLDFAVYVRNLTQTENVLVLSVTEFFCKPLIKF